MGQRDEEHRRVDQPLHTAQEKSSDDPYSSEEARLATQRSPPADGDHPQPSGSGSRHPASGNPHPSGDVLLVDDLGRPDDHLGRPGYVSQSLSEPHFLASATQQRIALAVCALCHHHPLGNCLGAERARFRLAGVSGHLFSSHRYLVGCHRYGLRAILRSGRPTQRDSRQRWTECDSDGLPGARRHGAFRRRCHVRVVNGRHEHHHFLDRHGHP